MIMENMFGIFLCVHLGTHSKLFVGSSPAFIDKGFLQNLTTSIGYDPQYRPVYNRSEQTIVQLSFVLNSIIGLDEKKEVISCSGLFMFVWKDKLLHWDVSGGDVPTILHLPLAAVWTPSLWLENSVTNLGLLKASGGGMILYNNGNAVYVFKGRTDTRCKFNIAKFPFDSQVCTLNVSVYYTSITGEKIDITNGEINLDKYEENGEFELINAYLQVVVEIIKERKQEIVLVVLKLKRRSFFYVLSNILPIVFLSVLNSFVFLLPEDSGEKMSLCVSTLLSYVVFLSVVTSYLPENSDNVCFFSIYLITLLLLSTITCIATIFHISLHSSLEKGLRIPVWMVRCLSRGRKIKNSDEAQEEIMKITRNTIKQFNMIAFITSMTITLLTNIIYFSLVLP